MGIRVSGYEQVNMLTAVVTLSPPTRTNYVIIDVRDQDVRWRSDGTNPSVTVGGYMKAGGQYEHAGRIEDLKFIGVVTGAELNCSYYFRTGGDHQ